LLCFSLAALWLAGIPARTFSGYATLQPWAGGCVWWLSKLALIASASSGNPGGLEKPFYVMAI